MTSSVTGIGLGPRPDPFGANSNKVYMGVDRGRWVFIALGKYVGSANLVMEVSKFWSRNEKKYFFWVAHRPFYVRKICVFKEGVVHRPLVPLGQGGAKFVTLAEI